MNKDKALHQPYVDGIECIDSWVERTNAATICINANTTKNYESVYSYLKGLESSKILAFETCKERVSGSFDDFPEDEKSV